jgi:hypothetical protein
MFDCGVGNQMDRCTVTMKEIAEYIGSIFTYGADMHGLLEGQVGVPDHFPSHEGDFDGFQLIKTVKGIAFHLEDSTYHLEALHYANIRFHGLRQGKDVDNNVKYLELFQPHVAIVEQFSSKVA